MPWNRERQDNQPNITYIRGDGGLRGGVRNTTTQSDGNLDTENAPQPSNRSRQSSKRSRQSSNSPRQPPNTHGPSNRFANDFENFTSQNHYRHRHPEPDNIDEIRDHILLRGLAVLGRDNMDILIYLLTASHSQGHFDICLWFLDRYEKSNPEKRASYVNGCRDAWARRKESPHLMEQWRQAHRLGLEEFRNDPVRYNAWKNNIRNTLRAQRNNPKLAQNLRGLHNLLDRLCPNMPGVKNNLKRNLHIRNSDIFNESFIHEFYTFASNIRPNNGNEPHRTDGEYCHSTPPSSSHNDWKTSPHKPAAGGGEKSPEYTQQGYFKDGVVVDDNEAEDSDYDESESEFESGSESDSDFEST